jgi:hypothetical protein
MSSSIVSGSDENKAGEVTHGIHEIGLATVICDFTRSPEVHMNNVKGAAERPREDELAVMGDGAIGGDAVRALKNPGLNTLYHTSLFFSFTSNQPAVVVSGMTFASLL